MYSAITTVIKAIMPYQQQQRYARPETREWTTGYQGYKLAPDQPPESGLLALDSSKARIGLGWRNLLGLREALNWTVNWTADMTKSQLFAFDDALAAIATPQR